MNVNELASVLSKISEKLECGKELITEDKILDFQLSAEEVAARIESVMEEGRVLRIGIVGEVKAGKSSFLNALLFNGEDILPKAPTPMTAALTRISYSETPKGKIVFYDKNDWDLIIDRSSRYDKQLDRMYEAYKRDIEQRVINREKTNKKESKHVPIRIISKEEFEKENREMIPLELRACKEVHDMAKDIDVNAYLGKEETINSSSTDKNGIPKELNQYVGAEGKFTPIVKYTEIQICNEMLKGVELIDTPGLNDPIRSRGRTTEKFLIECDAVFLLAYGGQFLGAEDMKFIMSSLPDEGIKNAVLIASKFDSMILQYPKSGASFKQAYLGSKKNVLESAESNIRSCRTNSHNDGILTQIKASLPPECVSSLAYSAAKKLRNGESYNEQEELMVANLKRRFSDFVEDYDTLMGLSNILDVRENVFEKTKAQKTQIIEDRVDKIVESQIVKFKRCLEDISNQAKCNLADLKKYDCDQLQEQLHTLQENLDSIRIVVKNLFEKAANDSKRTIMDMAGEVAVEMRHYQDIEVRVESKTHHHTSTSGHLMWKKEHHWDEVVNTNIAEINDVERNIRDYRNRVIEMINSGFRTLLKIEELKDAIKTSVMGAFEQADKNFDENRILIPLENALDRISFPKIDIDLEPYESMLDSMLSNIATKGVVKNDNIPELKRSQDKVIAKLADDIVEQMKKQGEEIDRSLQEESAEFVDSIVEQLKGNQEKIEALLEDKQEGVEKIENFISEILEAKKMLG